MLVVVWVEWSVLGWLSVRVCWLILHWLLRCAAQITVDHNTCRFQYRVHDNSAIRNSCSVVDLLNK